MSFNRSCSVVSADDPQALDQVAERLAELRRILAEDPNLNSVTDSDEFMQELRELENRIRTEHGPQVSSGQKKITNVTTSEENGWTKEYCRVQHFGYDTRRCSTGGRWATVTNWGEWAELDGWYQGCGFSPHKASFDTIEEARAAGEIWVKRGFLPQQEVA